MAKNETIQLHLNKHTYTESLLSQLNDFTKLTGINVQYSILSEEEFRDKLIIELSSGSGSVDVFMTGPYTAWSYLKAGWIESLDGYLNNPSLTTKEYDPEDFFSALLDANRWNGQPGYENYGKGDLLAVPIQVETYLLTYRKDWADELHLTTPKTYPEYFDFIRKLTRTINGEKAYGVTVRGLGTWSTIVTGFISAYTSYGCSDFDDKMNCLINSPEAIEFTGQWISNIRECGPVTWTSNNWYDTKEQFQSGRYGLIFDCDHFSSSYQNPEKSRVAGKLEYALPPAGRDGAIVSNFWTWSLAINKKSRHKLASWLFIQWATSKKQLLNASINGNWNPSRKSVWNDPQIIKIAEKWGNYREIVEMNLMKHARICLTPQPEIPAIGDRWARALQDIWSGNDSKATLDQAAKDIDQIMERAGLKKND